MSYYQTLGAPGAGLGLTGTPCGGTCYPLLDGSGVHLPPGQTGYRSPATVNNQQDNLTQEFRLQSTDPTAAVSWTLGTFFAVNRTFSLEQIHDPQVDSLFNTLYGTTIASLFGSPTNANGSSYLPSGDSYLNQLIGHDRQIAGFGEAVWSITDQLKLTAGMRYSKVDYTFTSYNDGPQNGGPVYGSGEHHEQPKTYRAGLSYQHDPNNLYYVTYSTGFRIGGANSLIPYNLWAPIRRRSGQQAQVEPAPRRVAPRGTGGRRKPLRGASIDLVAAALQARRHGTLVVVKGAIDVAAGL